MNCTKCGGGLNEAKICLKCGNKEAEAPGANLTSGPASPVNGKLPAEIRCGSCGYIGLGQNSRTVVAQVFAWLGLLITPFITIIYYLATSKYQCPKCKSTFLGIKNKEGMFVGQSKSAAAVVITIGVCLLAGMAIIGVLSGIVLTSLNSARGRAQEAAVKASLFQARTTAEIYFGKTGNYAGFCQDPETVTLLESLKTRGGSLDSACNDDPDGYEVAAKLQSGSWDCLKSEKPVVNRENLSFPSVENCTNI